MKTKFLALAFAALLPFAASAEVSYSYIEVDYIASGTMDVVGCCEFDVDGVGLKGSFTIGDSLYLQLDYSDLGTDPDIGSVSAYEVSLGWHGEMFFARLGYGQAEEPFGMNGGGYVFDVGLRSMVGDNFELNAHAGMLDLGDFGTGMSYGAGAVLLLGDSLGITFNYDIRAIDDFAATPGLQADFDTMRAGLRFNFD